MRFRLLTVLSQFLLLQSFFVSALMVSYVAFDLSLLFIISPSFGASGWLYFVIVAFLCIFTYRHENMPI